MKHIPKIFILTPCISISLDAGSGLIKAASRGDIPSLRERANAGEGVNEVDHRGWTPLMWAVYYEQLPATEWLLEKGADPNLQSNQGYKAFAKGSTALIIAGIQGLGDQVRALLKKKAKADLTDEKGLSVGDHARKSGNRSMLQALGIKVTLDPKLDELVAGIEAGKNVNAVDSFGWTPLMWAVYLQDFPTTEFFLEKGADPNLRTTAPFESINAGATALIIAGYYGLDEIATALVRKKARTDLADAKGNFAESYASQYHFASFINATSDLSPLKNSYQKVVFEGITLAPGIPQDVAYIAEECQLSALEMLTRNEGFQSVEMASPARSQDASTRILQLIPNLGDPGWASGSAMRGRNGGFWPSLLRP